MESEVLPNLLRKPLCNGYFHMLTPCSFCRIGGFVFTTSLKVFLLWLIMNSSFLNLKCLFSFSSYLPSLYIICVDPVQLGLRTYRCGGQHNVKVTVTNQYFCPLFWNPRTSKITSVLFWEQCFLCALLNNSLLPVVSAIFLLFCYSSETGSYVTGSGGGYNHPCCLLKRTLYQPAVSQCPVSLALW